MRDPSNQFAETARRNFVERTRPVEKDSTPGEDIVECLPGDDSIADATADALVTLVNPVPVFVPREQLRQWTGGSLPTLRAIKRRRDRERLAVSILSTIAGVWLRLRRLFS